MPRWPWTRSTSSRPKRHSILNARSDVAGKELDGRNSYVLRFTKGELPPVHSFWSATMYFAKGLMVPNAIHRYSIGDRTPGLSPGRTAASRL